MKRHQWPLTPSLRPSEGAPTAGKRRQRAQPARIPPKKFGVGASADASNRKVSGADRAGKENLSNASARSARGKVSNAAREENLSNPPADRTPAEGERRVRKQRRGLDAHKVRRSACTAVLDRSGHGPASKLTLDSPDVANEELAKLLGIEPWRMPDAPGGRNPAH